MRMTYVLIKDHLEQAQAILGDHDKESQQLGEVLQLVIGLVDELQLMAHRRSTNIVDFPLRARRMPTARD